MIVATVLITVFLAVLLAVWVLVRARVDLTALPDLRLWKDNVIPMMIVVHEDLPPEVTHYIQGAIGVWTRAIPGLFMPLNEVSLVGETIPVLPCTELVEWSKQDGCNVFANTRIMIGEDDHIQSAAIYVDVNMLKYLSGREIERGFAHELGHVLGLAHDANVKSVMHPTALDDAYGITSGDRAFIINHYGLHGADDAST